MKSSCERETCHSKSQVTSNSGVEHNCGGCESNYDLGRLTELNLPPWHYSSVFLILRVSLVVYAKSYLELNIQKRKKTKLNQNNKQHPINMTYFYSRY